LHANDLFAQAPPMGGATYGGGPPAKNAAGKRVVGDLSDDTIAMTDAEKRDTKAPHPQAQQNFHGGGAGRAPATVPLSKPADAHPPVLDGLARALQGSGNNIVVEGYANKEDQDKHAASLNRANKVREQLIRQGVDPNKVVAVGKGEQVGRSGGVQIVEEPLPPEQTKTKTGPAPEPLAVDPIGTSHFETPVAMTVPRASSAMVSILKTTTDGEVVYLFDPESARGNGSFAFRAVRIKNPTDSVLESGPVTVYGEGRFIGEGLCEPIPARSVAFVPFALDRQIVIETKEAERDDIARLIAVQRGVFSTEVQHTRKSTVTLHNRLPDKAVVYLRHTVPAGYKLSKGPASPERIGTAHLFRVEIPAGQKMDVDIEEQTPLFKTTDIRTPGGMELVRVFLSSAAQPLLKDRVAELLKIQQDIGNIEQRITTTREQMAEYKARMDELHVQIVTLKAVRTAGPLMTSLEKKLNEVSDKLSKATIDLVSFQEKLMVSRIHFQDGVADLTLEKKDDSKPAVAGTK
jgi:hypothetical protein